MSAPVPIIDRRSYRVAHWSAAVGALAACLYFFATSRGWLPGVSGPKYSFLMMGSSTAIIWSVLAFRRHEVLAIILMVLAGFLLIGSIISFVQAY